MSYYSIDDIETDAVIVPTRFMVEAPGLGFLLEESWSGQASKVPAGAEAMLPLWLATPLASAAVSENSDDAFLVMEEPSALQSDVLNVLKSDPLALDLRSQSRLFTNLGLEWVRLFMADQLWRVLYETARVRAAHIYDMALAQHGGEATLDEYETQLYQAVTRVVKDQRRWHRKT